eukprot:Gb_20437 [translate_table: standard]
MSSSHSAWEDGLVPIHSSKASPLSSLMSPFSTLASGLSLHPFSLTTVLLQLVPIGASLHPVLDQVPGFFVEDGRSQPDRQMLPGGISIETSPSYSARRRSRHSPSPSLKDVWRGGFPREGKDFHYCRCEVFVREEHLCLVHWSSSGVLWMD